MLMTAATSRAALGTDRCGLRSRARAQLYAAWVGGMHAGQLQGWVGVGHTALAENWLSLGPCGDLDHPKRTAARMWPPVAR